MFFSLDDYLQVVMPHLPAALVAPEGLQPIRRIARALPAVSLFGFESRLATPAATADFLIGLTASSGSGALFAGRTSDDDRVSRLLTQPGWAPFRALAAEWTNPASPLYADGGNVWLEFDVASGGDALAVPNVFFGSKAPGAARAVAATGLHCLLGRPPAAGVAQRLAGCFDALPPLAHIFQIGVMLARQVEDVRVCVVPLRWEEIAPYLERIGWPGPRDEVVDMLAPFCHRAARLALDVDVGEDVGPKIGLECCYLDECQNPQLDPRWPALLEQLVAEGLCTVDKRDALLGWPGLQRTSRFLWPSVFLRRLNHLKLVYAPGRPLEAKAYWGVIQHWSHTDVAMEAA